MNLLTKDFDAALNLFEKTLSLHDATIAGFAETNNGISCKIYFSDVYGHSKEDGFRVIYTNLVAELENFHCANLSLVRESIGYDVLDAELSDKSLRINTLCGQFTFNFTEMNFFG